MLLNKRKGFVLAEQFSKKILICTQPFFLVLLRLSMFNGFELKASTFLLTSLTT